MSHLRRVPLSRVAHCRFASAVFPHWSAFLLGPHIECFLPGVPPQRVLSSRCPPSRVLPSWCLPSKVLLEQSLPFTGVLQVSAPSRISPYRDSPAEFPITSILQKSVPSRLPLQVSPCRPSSAECSCSIHCGIESQSGLGTCTCRS